MLTAKLSFHTTMREHVRSYTCLCHCHLFREACWMQQPQQLRLSRPAFIVSKCSCSSNCESTSLATEAIVFTVPGFRRGTATSRQCAPKCRMHEKDCLVSICSEILFRSERWLMGLQRVTDTVGTLPHESDFSVTLSHS